MNNPLQVLLMSIAKTYRRQQSTGNVTMKIYTDKPTRDGFFVVDAKLSVLIENMCLVIDDAIRLRMILCWIMKLDGPSIRAALLALTSIGKVKRFEMKPCLAYNSHDLTSFRDCT